MELAKSRETSKRPSGDGISLAPRWGGPSPDRIDDSKAELHDEAIEHAWLSKSEMRWVRADHNPLGAFRWFVFDRFGMGDPPSRVQKKNHGRP
jgi:hypothetical protein